MYQVICLNADKTLNLLEIALTHPDGHKTAFEVIHKARSESDDGTAFLSDNDRLVLTLPTDQTLLLGSEDVEISLSWNAPLRKDGKGDAHQSTLHVSLSLLTALPTGYYLSNYGTPVDGVQPYFAVTQFECASARMMFPCWDEPSFKATFAVSMVTKEGLKCLSCMPEAEAPSNAQVELASSLSGEKWQTVHFDSTPPVSQQNLNSPLFISKLTFIVQMSTYLVAITSGPFNCLSDFYVSKISGNTVRLASWAVNEDYRHTTFILEVLKASLLYFEDLFDIPYPLPKLDVLVVPTFEAAAMENFGLVGGHPNIRSIRTLTDDTDL